MGSGFYSFEEAARRLGRSKRSVHNYVRDGFIKRRVENGVAVLDRADVDSLAVDQGVDLPAMNRKSFFQMQARLKKLEEEMTAVKHSLEIRDVQALRPDQITSMGMIQAAQTYLVTSERDEVWTTTLITQWSDIFERFDEETISLLTKISMDPQAWVPFFKFCSELADFCWGKDKEKPSLAWQVMATRLDTARQHLRRVIVTWLEMGRGTLPQQFMEALGSNREVLVGRMAKG